MSYVLPDSPKPNSAPIVWAFDPGLTTGYAQFDTDGNMVNFGSAKGLDSLVMFLENRPDAPNIIVVENYVIDPKTPQGGTEVIASEAIGCIYSYARLRKIEFVRQSRLIKGDAYRMIKQTPPKQKAMEHQFDAWAHGVYYLRTNNLIPGRKQALLDKLRTPKRD